MASLAGSQAYVREFRRAAAFIGARLPQKPVKTAVILGSGIGGAAPALDRRTLLPYHRIPGFPRTTVSGHQGNLILGASRGQGVAIFQGRFHYYEGHGMEAVTLPIRALKELGLETLVVTAAVGSLKLRIKPGHIVVLRDHLNFMGLNPLRGFHQKEFGEMFPDLAQAYDPALRKLALEACRRLKIPASQGVYAAVGGPSYETPAEVRALRLLGCDVVGMSVVPEVIVARQMGVRALGLSWVSNLAAGLSRDVLAHADVLTMGARAASSIKKLLEDLLPRLVQQ